MKNSFLPFTNTIKPNVYSPCGNCITQLNIKISIFELNTNTFLGGVNGTSYALVTVHGVKNTKYKFRFVAEEGTYDASLGIPGDYDFYQGSSSGSGCQNKPNATVAFGYICQGYTLTDYITTDDKGNFVFLITNCIVGNHFTYGSIEIYYQDFSQKIYFNTVP